LSGSALPYQESFRCQATCPDLGKMSGQPQTNRCTLAGWPVWFLPGAAAAVVFAACLHCLLLPSSTAEAETEVGSAVFFYNSETNINNFSMLKGEFDAYLSTKGGHRFQPFSKRTDFERFVLARTQGVILVSSWHFQRLREQMALDPVMVGMSGNECTHKRVLTAKKSIPDATALRGQRIASAGSRDSTITALRKMLPPDQHELIDSLKILVVPKDIDALMAVSFGMAKAALTTEGSLHKLQKINPKQHELLHPLATSEGTLLPVVAVLKGASAGDRNLLAVIEAMGQRPEGVERLRMIGLDRLRKLDESEKQILLQ